MNMTLKHLCLILMMFSSCSFAAADGILCNADKAMALVRQNNSKEWDSIEPESGTFFLTVELDSAKGFSVGALGDPVPYLSGDDCQMLESDKSTAIVCDNIMSSFRLDVETAQFVFAQHSGLWRSAENGQLVTVVGRCTTYRGHNN